VRNLVRLLYIGGDFVELIGPETNLRYYVAPHRRDFAVERPDATGLLKRPDVILAVGEKFST
jgi:hypothetical protein